MLTDVLINKNITGSEKGIWTGVVLFGYALGGLAYFVAIKKEKTISCLLFISLIITFPTLIGLGVKTIKKERQQEYKINKIVSNQRSPINKTIVNPKDIREIEKKSKNKRSPVDEAIVDPREVLKREQEAKRTFLILNKSEYRNNPIRTHQEIANIDKSKYNDEISSWVDKKGKIHFTNTDIENSKVTIRE
jgi:hypothetical protein